MLNSWKQNSFDWPYSIHKGKNKHLNGTSVDWTHLTYRLIAKQDVDVRHNLHQGLFKELADEWCWEVHAEDLVLIWSMLCHLEDWLRGHSQEKTLKQKSETKIFTTLSFQQFGCLQLNHTNDSVQSSSVLYRQRYFCFDRVTWARMEWTAAGSCKLKHFKLLICGFQILTRQFQGDMASYH